LTDRRHCSGILDVRNFRGADCNTDHYLVVAEVRERLTVIKKSQKLNLRKLNDLEVRKQSQIEISNRLATLESWSDSEGINRAWENIKENIKTSVNRESWSAR
jgi:hypothetical protein